MIIYNFYYNVKMGKKLTIEEFIERGNKVHNNKYDYSLVDYKNGLIKVKIICPKHGMFEQTPKNHFKGSGCKKCGLIIVKEKQILGREQFIKKANKVHNNKYDYTKINYINSHTKIKIICPKHGMFEQIPSNHLKGQGCSLCKGSKGEKTIRNYLLKNNVKFEKEKTFKNCKNENCLPFDFYLPEHNLLIEYDGIQHFKPIDFFGGKKTFDLLKINDNIKNKFAINNNINLLRISYKEFNNINNILNKKLI